MSELGGIGGTVRTFLSDARPGVTLVDRALRHTGWDEGEPAAVAPPARAAEPGVVGQAGGGDE